MFSMTSRFRFVKDHVRERKSGIRERNMTREIAGVTKLMKWGKMERGRENVHERNCES